VVAYSPKKLGEATSELPLAAQAQEPKARIEATPDEFHRAQWAYIGENAGPLGSTEMQFQRGNYTVAATFWGGYCHELMIMDSVMVEAPDSAYLILAGKELTGAYKDFIITVLESNAGGAEWREQKSLTRYAREWMRSDAQVTARYIGGGRLTLITKEFSDAQVADNQKREKRVSKASSLGGPLHLTNECRQSRHAKAKTPTVLPGCPK
jgi:hypothetical protein